MIHVIGPLCIGAAVVLLTVLAALRPIPPAEVNRY